MAFDMDWSHSFCLTCDRQTDGNVYCSEACRLAEYEDTASSTGSITSSPPPSPRSNFTWHTPKLSANSFSPQLSSSSSSSSSYLSNDRYPTALAYHQSYSSPRRSQSPPQPSDIYNTSPVTWSYSSNLPSPKISSPPPPPNHPSTMVTTTTLSSLDISQLSEESKRALRIYANSFNQSRYNRRQSGN